MYYQMYKSRLLTAHQDGADWRVLLDESFLTERHATPQAALQDAMRWIKSQEARMTIDDIIGRLHLVYVPADWQTSQPARISNRDITDWSEATGLSRSALYDAIAVSIGLS